MKFRSIIVACLLIPAGILAAEAALLVQNGGFEDGVKEWQYGAWKGLEAPGRIEKENSPEGKKHFVLTEPGTTEMRFIHTNAFPVNGSKNYIMKCTLATKDIDKKDIEVRILQYGEKTKKKTSVTGWYSPTGSKVYNLINDLDGTTAWKTYEVKLPGKHIDPKTKTMAIYFQHKNPSIGELKIDAVSVVEE